VAVTINLVKTALMTSNNMNNRTLGDIMYCRTLKSNTVMTSYVLYSQSSTYGHTLRDFNLVDSQRCLLLYRCLVSASTSLCGGRIPHLIGVICGLPPLTLSTGNGTNLKEHSLFRWIIYGTTFLQIFSHPHLSFRENVC
jgi:hypothetical protein